MKILTKGTYYGQKKMELDSKGILLSEYDYTLPETDWHYHENPYFMYVLNGNVLDINKKRKTTCPAGSFLLHNWNEQHMNTKESNSARGFHIEFERKWFDQKKLNVDLWEGSQLIEDPRMHSILGKLYLEFKCWDSFSEASIDLLLFQLCEQTQRRHESAMLKEPSWIQTLKELLNEEVENLSLGSLSNTLGVHPAHLSRAVPKYLQTTLGDYIRQQKVKKALQYLLDPNFSLTEITYICGFADQSHFTRTFKRYYHKTPKDFRKQLGSC
ncbi:MAG: helix-turn-helix transcriptional regulator [Bacteroidota bacterium]